MFVPIWIAFLLSGLLMAGGVIIWAVRTKQFEDQDRARFLPLVDLSPQELTQRPGVRHSMTLYANLVVLLCGVVALVTTAIIVIRHV